LMMALITDGYAWAGAAITKLTKSAHEIQSGPGCWHSEIGG